MPREPAFRDLEMRKGRIIFAKGATYSAFCDGLDGGAGVKDLDSRMQTYYANLTERQHNLVLNTDFVSDVLLHTTEREFTAKQEPHEGALRIGRWQADLAFQAHSPEYLSRVSQPLGLDLEELNYSFKTPPARASRSLSLVAGSHTTTPK